VVVEVSGVKTPEAVNVGRRTYFILASPGEGTAPEYAGFVACRESELEDYQTMLWWVAREVGAPCVYMTRVEAAIFPDQGLVQWGSDMQPSFGYTQEDVRNSLTSYVKKWKEAGLIK